VGFQTSVKKRGKKAREEDSFSKVNAKWQVVCYTEEDWQLLTRKFKNCKSLHEKNLHATLRDDFLPELPRLFAEKERLQRKRMLEQQLRRNNRNSVSQSNHSEGSNDTVAVSRRESFEQISKSIIGNCSNNTYSNNTNCGVAEKENQIIMEEDDLKKKRLEQEEADRLLAEEIQKEEMLARNLRERRGGAVANSGYSSSNSRFSSSSSVIHEKKFRTSSTSKSGVKSGSNTSISGSKCKEDIHSGSGRSNKVYLDSDSSPKKSSSAKKKRRKSKNSQVKTGRMTNNSLSASLAVDEDDDDEDGSLKVNGTASDSRDTADEALSEDELSRCSTPNSYDKVSKKRKLSVLASGKNKKSKESKESNGDSEDRHQHKKTKKKHKSEKSSGAKKNRSNDTPPLGGTSKTKMKSSVM